MSAAKCELGLPDRRTGIEMENLRKCLWIEFCLLPFVGLVIISISHTVYSDAPSHEKSNLAFRPPRHRFPHRALRHKYTDVYRYHIHISV